MYTQSTTFFLPHPHIQHIKLQTKITEPSFPQLELLSWRPSIQAPFSINQNMLSKSDDFKIKKQEPLEGLDALEKDQNKQDSIGPKIQEYEDQLVKNLDLSKLLREKNGSRKNILRNYGNGQNQFIIQNQHSRRLISSALQNPQQFIQWIRKLPLTSFKDYKKVWTLQSTDSPKILIYKKLYKQLCWTFYVQHAIPYIYSGRIHDSQTKACHLKQVHVMMKGLQKPHLFHSFKNW